MNLLIICIIISKTIRKRLFKNFEINVAAACTDGSKVNNHILSARGIIYDFKEIGPHQNVSTGTNDFSKKILKSE